MERQIIQGYLARTSQYTYRYAHDKRISMCYLHTAEIQGSDLLRCYRLTSKNANPTAQHHISKYLHPEKDFSEINCHRIVTDLKVL